MGPILKLLFFVVILHLEAVHSTGDDLTAYSQPELDHDSTCPIGTVTTKTALVTRGIWALGSPHVYCGSKMRVYCLGYGCIINPETEDSSVLVTIVGSVPNDHRALFILSQDSFLTITEEGSLLMRTECRLVSEVRVSTGLMGEVTMTAVTGEEVTVSAESKDGEETVDNPTISEEVTVSTESKEEEEVTVDNPDLS